MTDSALPPIPSAPPFTPARKALLVLTDLYLHAVFVGGVVTFLSAHFVQHSLLLFATQMPIMLLLLSVMELHLIPSRVKLWKESRAKKAPYLKSVFENEFELRAKHKFARRTLPKFKRRVFLLIPLSSFFYLGLGLFIAFKIQWNNASINPPTLWIIKFSSLISLGIGLWILGVFIRINRNARHSGKTLQEYMEIRMSEREDRRVELARQPSTRKIYLGWIVRAGIAIFFFSLLLFHPLGIRVAYPVHSLQSYLALWLLPACFMSLFEPFNFALYGGAPTVAKDPS